MSTRKTGHESQQPQQVSEPPTTVTVKEFVQLLLQLPAEKVPAAAAKLHQLPGAGWRALLNHLIDVLRRGSTTRAVAASRLLQALGPRILPRLHLACFKHRGARFTQRALEIIQGVDSPSDVLGQMDSLNVVGLALQHADPAVRDQAWEVQRALRQRQRAATAASPTETSGPTTDTVTSAAPPYPEGETGAEAEG